MVSSKHATSSYPPGPSGVRKVKAIREMHDSRRLEHPTRLLNIDSGRRPISSTWIWAKDSRESSALAPGHKNKTILTCVSTMWMRILPRVLRKPLRDARACFFFFFFPSGTEMVHFPEFALARL